MRDSQLKTILEENELRNTKCRNDVLSLFLSADFALAPKDLENKLQQYDRVTLYRTLNTFIEKGIIHKIPNDSGIARYAVTGSEKNKEFSEEHIHFKCEECERTECLNDYHIPKVKLPAGYEARAINLIVTGKCQKCRGRKR